LPRQNKSEDLSLGDAARDSVEELELLPGVVATAFVKATSVMIERGEA
jgi:hypothetical protein